MKKLRNARKSRKLTQSGLARLSGVSQPYINELENGKKINPSILVLVKLAKAMGITVSELLDDEVNEGIAGHFFKEAAVKFTVAV